MKKYSVGIDLGGTKILIALVNKETGEVIYHVKKKTKKDKGPKNIMKKMIEGIEELFEESRYTPNPWRAEPMSREYLKNILQRDREITRQVLEDIERETVGYISPDAKKDIDKEISKIQK